MRIAVLFFGQPRFFDVTAPFIKKYLQQISRLDGTKPSVEVHNDEAFARIKVDCFAHFWKYVGYKNADHKLEEEINVDKLTDILKEFNVIDYCIEDYTNLNKFIDNITTCYDIIDGELNATPDRRRKHNPDGLWRYRSVQQSGQYYSLNEAYNLMVNHENNNNFKYDVILRIRTDYILQGQDIYSLIKFKSYDIPCIKVGHHSLGVPGTIASRSIRLQLEDEQDHYTIGDLHSGSGGITRLKDSLYAYNRLGAETFIQKHFLFYFYFYCNDALRLPIPLPHLKEHIGITSDTRYGCVEFIIGLISGLTGAEVEVLDYNIQRVRCSRSSLKRVQRDEHRENDNTSMVSTLSAYGTFNDDNTACIPELNVYIENWLQTLPAHLDRKKQKSIYRRKYLKSVLDKL